LADSPVVILDSLRGHFAEDSALEWEQLGATLYRLPAASGKSLNPCDQAINREMRRTFLQLQQLNRRDKLNNIISAYYSVTEETIVASFDRCGLFKGDPEDIISAQASQGFHSTPARRVDCSRYEKAFTDWMRYSVRNPADVLPRSKKPRALKSGLSGCH
jgi:hypothetical protein